MVRTQIYLDEAQKAELERLSSERRMTVSGLIRQAIDQFLGKGSIDFPGALKRSFGIWRDRTDLGDSTDYVRAIREEWDERSKRM